MKLTVRPAALLMLPLIGVITLPAAAQESRGAITGTVTDQQGALLPRASVKIVNTATNLATTTATNESGIYVVRSFPAASTT